jgi:release factor glutamine methyltransferase
VTISQIKKEQHNIDMLDLDMLLCFVLQKTRVFLYSHDDYVLSSDEISSIKKVIRQRQNNKPLSYITGKKEFYGFDFLVNEAVLIPRPQTEMIIDIVLKLAKKEQPIKVLELGCGCGCISIVLAKMLPNAKITCTDISSEAMVVCQQNITYHKIENIKLIKSDWFADIPYQKFDFLISNPPYVDREDTNKMNEETTYEPKIALFSSDGGMASLRSIIAKSKDYLKTHLILEHGFNQKDRVQKELKKFNFKNIKTFNDSLSHPRISTANI